MQPKPCAETVRPWVPRARLGIAMGHGTVTKRQRVVSKVTPVTRVEGMPRTAETTDTPKIGRPRSPEADAAIRQATVDLLATEGYANLTMSGVAAQAGVSTATLYRRWSSKLELVLDTLTARAEESPVPDTGSLEGDCRAIVHNLVGKARTTKATPLLAGLVGEIPRKADLAGAVRASLSGPRRAAFNELFARAAERGELREG